LVKDKKKTCLQKISDARCVTLEVYQGDRRIICYVDDTRNNEKRTGERIYRYQIVLRRFAWQDLKQDGRIRVGKRSD